MALASYSGALAALRGFVAVPAAQHFQRRSKHENIYREANLMVLHPDVTLDRILVAVEATMFELDMIGFCIKCGAENDLCEPDAERLYCEACGYHEVYGAEQLLLHICP